MALGVTNVEPRKFYTEGQAIANPDSIAWSPLHIFRRKMGRTLVYPKVQKNTVHRKNDRGKLLHSGIRSRRSS